MGKRGRKRHGAQAKWLRQEPDEIFRRGPFAVARYGRIVQYSNTSTPQEHQDYLRAAADAHREVVRNLAASIARLQDLISEYDPVALMHRAACVLVLPFLRHRSESEFSREESLFLPGVEYIQYLIARTEPAINGREPTEAEWETLWPLTLEVLRLTQSYLFTRETGSDPPSELDMLRFSIDGMRLGVRVQRHPFFLADYWRAALEPYGLWIEALYGIGADKLIAGLRQIEEHQKTGLPDSYQDALAAFHNLMERLADSGLTVDLGAPETEAERTRLALASPEFSDDYRAAQEKARLTFTAAVFDITEKTSLPRSVLSALAVRPGEAVLRDPTLRQHDDLSPLSNSVLHFKPFIQVGDRFYFFYHSGLEDHVAEIIESELLGAFPSDTTRMVKRHSDHIEGVARDLLSRVLQPDLAITQAYYPNPDRPGDLTELDILIGVDDVLFLVEVKSGGMSDAGNRGAPKSLASDLSDIIIAGQRQSERAERYIRSAPHVDLFDETGRRPVHRLNVGDYRLVFRVVITRENIGWVGAQIAVLAVLEPRMSSAYPWHISIDDLRVITDLFEGNSLQFVHFLEQRLRASAVATLSQHDEIEHVALYHHMNQYHEPLVKGVHRMSFAPSYMRAIDSYLSARYAGEDPPRPNQRVPANLKRLIEALGACCLRSRFEAGSLILSMGQYGRDELDAALTDLEARRAAGRQPSIHLPFDDGTSGLSLTYASGSNFNKERLACAARLHRGGRSRWVLVQLANHSEYHVTAIDVIVPRSFSDTELNPALAYLGQQVANARATRRVGRNEPCPCGSGRKYKKCHGG